MNTAEIRQAVTQYKTPFYIFDSDILAERIKKLRDVLGSSAQICYAMKANPFIIKELEDIVDGFEVCSPGEFRICERAEIATNKIVMSGVNKNPADVEYALEKYGSDIIYTVESPLQWKILSEYTSKYKVHIKALLRLTLGNQFGMDEVDIKRIVCERNDSPYITVEGIQYFAGTQKKSGSKFEKEFAMLGRLCSDLLSEYGYKAEKLEYGPGLPVCYFSDEEDAGDALLQKLAQQIRLLDFDGTITLEMGRYIAATCGVYVTNVADIKVNKGESYCIVDGGINHINYFGQMMAMKKPPIIHLDEKNGEPESWTVCGSLCTTNDVLVKQYPFTDLKIGDTLVFDKAGAYSVTEGISLFLSRELPQVFLYSQKDGLRLARRSYPSDSLNYFQNK